MRPELPECPIDGSTVVYDERWRTLPNGMRVRLHARGELDDATIGRASAHELVELRALLVERVEAIDARLRELDGRNTAGAPSLRREEAER